MALKMFQEDFVQYGSKPSLGFNVIQTSREGVLRSVADDVSKLVGLTDNEIAYVLGMTPRNLHRILPEKKLGTEASERLLLLRNILIHALDTFEGRGNTVRHWLRTPMRELNDQSPLQLMDTITGFGLVDDVLGRLDYGLPA
ncbi:antitoxin Xre/MbcA/ParS toxin-binding domain-containing protein [Dyadobacter arcticus]|uniref:Toxin-antitoxin system antitoxin component (TIGR02293 family) n=1 Tax=Dyadobacter arcticus TaxID=1078754 RepID=A0ABX0UUZ6_9BACT|nr:antitoxin Xre/MbcA/ParS toxin-binding domain-containing protein [Dyadobacter arcticus]NIJ56054.1 putative toxin-antitoxin system antitoxin component (TIGR02293 family) [Dyadobacter arcticus]